MTCSQSRITFNTFSSHCLIPDTAFSGLLMQHLTSTRATLKSWLMSHRLSIIHNVKIHYYSLQNCGCWAAKFGTCVIPMSGKSSPRSVSVSLLQIIPSFPSSKFSYPISFILVLCHPLKILMCVHQHLAKPRDPNAWGFQD